MISFMSKILVYNILRPFPYGRCYFEKQFPLHRSGGTDTGNKSISYISKILDYGSSNFGASGIIGANAALFLFGMIFILAVDILHARSSAAGFNIFCNILCFALCIYKFDIAPPLDGRSCIKLLYALYNLISWPVWSLTYLFFVAFENI